jgi:hypothetical protein
MNFLTKLFTKRNNKEMINNLRFLIYTHDKNLSLAELSLKYFFKHNKREDLKLTLVSNKFTTEDFKYKDRVSYFSSDVDLHCQGHHFKDSMISALSQMTEDYVFFLLDDYFFIDEIKYDDLNDVLNLMKCEGIDYFGFDDIGGILKLIDFERLNSTCESNVKEELYLRHKDYQYLFSVQPCIWKRTSLIELLSNQEKVSLHDLDETKSYIREDGLKLKGTMSGLRSCFDYAFDFDLQKSPENFYVIAYTEIVRHGCFNIPENGKPVSPNDYSVRFTHKLIEDEDLGSQKGFKHLLPPSLYKLND